MVSAPIIARCQHRNWYFPEPHLQEASDGRAGTVRARQACVVASIPDAQDDSAPLVVIIGLISTRSGIPSMTAVLYNMLRCPLSVPFSGGAFRFPLRYTPARCHSCQRASCPRTRCNPSSTRTQRAIRAWCYARPCRSAATICWSVNWLMHIDASASHTSAVMTRCAPYAAGESTTGVPGGIPGGGPEGRSAGDGRGGDAGNAVPMAPVSGMRASIA